MSEPRSVEAVVADEPEGPPLPNQGPAAPKAFPAWARLEDQIRWYDSHSLHNQHWFKGLKLVQILVAAAIPVAAGLEAPMWLVGGAGALIVALEGVQQLQQYQQNWTTYRSTAERLKHEKFLFLARSGAYASAERPEGLLAERVEGLVSQEHAAWASHQEDAPRAGGDGH